MRRRRDKTLVRRGHDRFATGTGTPAIFTLSE